MRRTRYRWKRIFALAATVVLLGAAGAPFLWVSDGELIPGVYIHDMKVGGKTRSELSAILAARNEELAAGALTLTRGETAERISYKDLHVAYDEKSIEEAMALGRTGPLWQRSFDRWRILLSGESAKVEASYDETALQAKVDALVEKYGKPPQNPTPTFLQDGSVKFTEGRPYYKIEKEKLLEAAKAIVSTGKSGEMEIPISEAKDPEMTKVEAAAIDTVLGQYTTYFTAGGNRSKNIELAAHSISGIYVKPGGDFSYNQSTGSRSADNGYLEAPVIINGKLEPGAGGGVCQVSSTLFNTVILAGLQVTERTCHFSPVAYAPMGRDATVAEGYLDFCFRNHLKSGVYVYTVYEPGAVTAYILGNKNDKPSAVDISEVENETLPFKTITRIDPSQEEEKKVEEGHEGYNVRINQSVTWADGRTYHDSFYSDYEPVDTIITYKKDPAVVVKEKEKAKVETKAKKVVVKGKQG